MNKQDLMKLPNSELADVILRMGHIIRHLDEDSTYSEYWTQDGEYLIDIPRPKVVELDMNYVEEMWKSGGLSVKRSEISHYHHWDNGKEYQHSHKGGEVRHGHNGSRYGKYGL